MAAAERLGVALSVAAVERLVRYQELLAERAIPLGMIASSDRDRLLERHVLDSLRVVPEIPTGAEGAVDALDLGSGAGLPGIAVAIALPHLRVGLVEPRQRRAAFCELAIERLELANAVVLARPLEDLTDPVDVCVSRALAPPAELWVSAERLLRPNGRLVVLAGEGFRIPDGPGQARVRVVANPVLESAGPLVIMTRQ